MSIFAQHLVDGVVIGAILSLPALGIAIIWRIAGFPHVAHGSLMTVPAYIAWVAVSGLNWPWLVAIVIALISSAALGVAMHLAIYRPLSGRPMFSMFLASVGLGLIFRFGAAAIFGHQFLNFPVGAIRGLTILGLTINPLDLIVIASALIGLVGTWTLLKMTMIGRQMRAVADNVSLARVSGIEPTRTLIHMWILVSVLAGMSGVLLGVRNTLYPDLGWDLLLPTFAAAIVGGIVNPYGAVVGALLIGVVQNVGIIWISPAYGQAIAFAAIALILGFRPTGLFGQSGRV